MPPYLMDKNKRRIVLTERSYEILAEFKKSADLLRDMSPPELLEHFMEANLAAARRYNTMRVIISNLDYLNQQRQWRLEPPLSLQWMLNIFNENLAQGDAPFTVDDFTAHPTLAAKLAEFNWPLLEQEDPCLPKTSTS